ncbi:MULTISPECIES: hypothetical protein [Streptomyces]|uniref:Uncharacterized protein n=1 Tax=Streptomyces mimosae TaxID=2586635 RepID=A0A5N6A4T6_9ACTN|nr:MULTISPECIES: hypothetical protein [Streptomyces]KAB8163804.1 hypothetical protein FH607_017860 [Streptomyces mimosae]KAB8175247.1 hypothetical protein FH609_019320 [Streptomyces sp. 3MP-14]
MAETPSTHHVIRVRFDGGPRHGRTVDLLITGQVPLPLMLAARRGPEEDAGSGLYQLRSTEGGGTRYAWIDDLPARS